MDLHALREALLRFYNVGRHIHLTERWLKAKKPCNI
jgi:hypothetical protein